MPYEEAFHDAELALKSGDARTAAEAMQALQKRVRDLAATGG